MLIANPHMGTKLMNLITPHTQSLILVFSKLLHVKGRKEILLNNPQDAGTFAAGIDFLHV